MNVETQNVEQLGIDTVRVLAVDAVQKANSGHPGMPMGAAPMGHVLWSEAMNYSPTNPNGQTATVLSFLPGTVVCCNIAICI